jgi:hypothetical protein
MGPDPSKSREDGVPHVFVFRYIFVKSTMVCAFAGLALGKAQSTIVAMNGCSEPRAGSQGVVSLAEKLVMLHKLSVRPLMLTS